MPSIVHAANPMILLNFSVRMLTGAFALSVLLTVAHADAPYSFEATPGQLPKTVAPIHYTLDLQPNLEALTVTGSAVIDIEVLKPTDRLVLNAVDMTFSAAALDGVALAPTIAVDKDAQTVTLSFSHAIETGRYKLRIAYLGQINKFGRGIYSIDYRTDDGRKQMIASHSEPSFDQKPTAAWGGQTGRAVQGGDGPDSLPDGGRLPSLRRERVHVGCQCLRCGGKGSQALGRSPAGEGQRRLAQGPLGLRRQCALKVSAGAYGVALGRTDALKGALRRLWCIYSLIERIHSVLAAAGARPAHG